MLNPHSAAELSLDDIEKMTLELIDAHGHLWRCIDKHEKHRLCRCFQIVEKVAGAGAPIASPRGKLS